LQAESVKTMPNKILAIHMDFIFYSPVDL